jgi:hypothetical protein
VRRGGQHAGRDVQADCRAAASDQIAADLRRPAADVKHGAVGKVSERGVEELGVGIRLT